ncbi:GNAT family N-acetyltransferase [Kineococcus sp. NUM-3379]
MDVTVTDNADMHRYEGRVGGELAAVAEYSRAPRFLVFSHTEVLPGHEGRGIASVVVRRALDDVRRQGLSIVPLCPFVDRFVRKHADEYGELVLRSPARVPAEVD